LTTSAAPGTAAAGLPGNAENHSAPVKRPSRKPRRTRQATRRKAAPTLDLDARWLGRRGIWRSREFP
ncbi:hypothetical protein ABT279_49380, partial [Amycolatopsis sp. NPDC000673]|uniref:hypothetical protein n=1 Tax=Amycolatopsis sp. NPDC000673 TaxID=3154267 RepID=UPI003322BECF